MKEPRVFQIVLMSVFGVLALLGLLLFATFSGNGNTATNAGPVVIWGTLPKDAVNAGIVELALASEDFDKVTYVEKTEAEWNNDLSDALASGEGPDLVIISQEELISEAGKLSVIPFTSFPERTYVDSFLPLYELFLTEEGFYGMPLIADPLVLYYNRSILASESVPTPPTTWEAVSGIAPKISKRDDASAITRSILPFGEYGNVTNARAIISLLLLQSGAKLSERTDRGVESRMASSGQDAASFGQSPAETAVAYFSQFSDPAKTVYSWNRSLPASRDAFLAGDLALYPGFASELPYLLSANPNLDFDMTGVPQPGTAAAKVGYAKGYVVAVTKTSLNPYGAQKTALGFSLAAPGAAIARMLGMAPAHRASLIAPENDRYAAVYYPEALIAHGWLSPSPDETDVVFSSMIGNISSGRMEIIQALQTATNALNALYRD